MSLAPAERRALDKIEDGLRRSDWRLARMLTRFSVPLSRGGLIILAYRFRRRRRLIGWAVAATVMALIVVVLVHSPTTPLMCPAPSGSGSAATASQAGACELTMYRGHEASTAENGTSK
jgi:Protein of unknown function (DUF3040)